MLPEQGFRYSSNLCPNERLVHQPFRLYSHKFKVCGHFFLAVGDLPKQIKSIATIDAAIMEVLTLGGVMLLRDMARKLNPDPLFNNAPRPWVNVSVNFAEPGICNHTTERVFVWDDRHLFQSSPIVERKDRMTGFMVGNHRQSM